MPLRALPPQGSTSDQFRHLGKMNCFIFPPIHFGIADASLRAGDRGHRQTLTKKFIFVKWIFYFFYSAFSVTSVASSEAVTERILPRTSFTALVRM